MNPEKRRIVRKVRNTTKHNREIQNANLAEVIKKKLRLNQEILSKNWGEDEDYNPWNPYVGVKQLSSIELDSDEGPEMEQRRQS